MLRRIYLQARALQSPREADEWSSVRSMAGVHLSALKSLYQEACAHELWQTKPETILPAIIFPKTEKTKRSYIDILEGDASDGWPLVAPPNVFVCYSWEYDMELILAVLDNVALKALPAPTYFWMDMLTVNFHEVDQGPHPTEFWCKVLNPPLCAVDKVVVICSPWDNPLPLKRLWCLWEIFEATQAGIPIEFHLPPREIRSLFDCVRRKGFESLDEVGNRLDVRKAETSIPQDKAQILEDITHRVGGVQVFMEKLRSMYLTSLWAHVLPK
jgi:hypothetical protein